MNTSLTENRDKNHQLSIFNLSLYTTNKYLLNISDKKVLEKVIETDYLLDIFYKNLH